jgi:ADP-heptose:LPS heptosyltransferase
MSEIKKLLFIHPGGLGDVLLLVPALEELRKKVGPQALIELLVENRAFIGSKEFFLESSDKALLINKVSCFDFKGKSLLTKIPNLLRQIQGFDCVIASGSSPKVAMLLFLSRAPKRIGYKSKLSFLLTDAVTLNKNQYAAHMLSDLLKPVSSVQNLDDHANEQFPDPTGKLKDLAKQVEVSKHLDSTNSASPVDELVNTRYVLIHPGVSALSITKRIKKTPGLDFWLQLCRLILQRQAQYNCKLAIVAGPDERDFATQLVSSIKSSPEYSLESFHSDSSSTVSSDVQEVIKNRFIDLSQQKFKINELAQLIKNSQAFICADSAPLHLAVGVGANIVSIFGPTDPSKLVPSSQDYTERFPQKSIKVAQVSNLSCSPCLWNRNACSCASPICIDWLEPEDLIKHLDQTLL